MLMAYGMQKQGHKTATFSVEGHTTLRPFRLFAMEDHCLQSSGQIQTFDQVGLVGPLCVICQ